MRIDNDGIRDERFWTFELKLRGEQKDGPDIVKHYLVQFTEKAMEEHSTMENGPHFYEENKLRETLDHYFNMRVEDYAKCEASAAFLDEVGFERTSNQLKGQRSEPSTPQDFLTENGSKVWRLS